MSFLESDDASFLSMEVDGFVHPGFKIVRDFFHGVDYGGNLDIQSFSEESLYFGSISCLGLHY